MINELSETTWKWMHALRIPVSKRWLRKEMEKHPDYPSLLSITDTLTSLGIENVALEIGPENLRELPVPFLALVGDGQNPFRIVTEVPSPLEPQAEFYKKWKGIVVAAERPARFNHPENTLTLKQEKKERWLTSLLSCIMAAFSLLAIFTSSFSMLFSLLIISSLAGIGVSLLIVFEALGIRNELTHRFCPTNENTDCAAVIGSASSLIKGIGWSDVGMIYFISQWLLLLIAGIGHDNGYYGLFTWLALGSIPFIIFSIYYQYRVAGKWCLLCLSVLAILLLQCAGLLMLRNDWFTAVPWKNIYIAAALFAGIAATWFLFQSMLKNMLALKKELAPSLRFKNNTRVFMHLLGQQQRVDTAPFTGELQLANGQAPLHIVVACNPYCQPCAEAHTVFDQLADSYGSMIRISVRFAIAGTDTSDPKVNAVNYLLQVIHEGAHEPGASRLELTKKILHHWFARQELPGFMKKYPLRENIDLTHELRQHADWARKTVIPFTPTIFINGYTLPEQYDAHDLPVLVRSLLNDEELLTSL